MVKKPTVEECFEAWWPLSDCCSDFEGKDERAKEAFFAGWALAKSKNPLERELIFFYDPPSGWRYGFPKVYNPKPNESIKDTLIRDGYPADKIDDGVIKHVRHWYQDYLKSDPNHPDNWTRKERT